MKYYKYHFKDNISQFYEIAFKIYLQVEIWLAILVIDRRYLTLCQNY
jgi:hypothetical protein